MGIRREARFASYSALRDDLIHIADETNKMRLDLVEAQKKYSEAVGRLIEESDRLLKVALTERAADGSLRKEFTPDTNVEAVADFVRPGRKCSNCQEPGHTARTCTNVRAPKIDEDDEAGEDFAGSRPRKRRKPLSEERKAQLREQLKRARAARSKR